MRKGMVGNMVIVWQEMKKILSWRKLLYLVVFAFLYYLMLLKPYIRSDGAESYHEEVKIVSTFIEEYGTELSPQEFEELKSQRPEYVYSQVDLYIEGNEEFGQLGIHNFAELVHSMGGNGLSLEEENRLWFGLYNALPQVNLSEEMGRLITLDIWNYYIDTYEQEALGTGTGYYKELDEAQRRRVEERNEREVYSFMPANVMYYNFEVLRFLGAFLVLCNLFLILPYMVSENRSRMTALQYSFRKGRVSYDYRLTAVLLSSLLVVVLVMAAYGWIAGRNRVTSFWDCSLSAYASNFISWMPWTLGQYSICHLVIAGAFSLGLALVVFVVTCYLENYITAIACLLPGMIGGIAFCGLVMFKFDEISDSRGLVPIVSGIVLCLGVLAALVQGMVERRRDIQVF